MRKPSCLAVAFALVATLSVAVRAALPASDSFAGTEDPLTTNWTTPGGVDTFQKESGVAWPKTGANYSYAYWDIDTLGNDQYSQATLGGSVIASFYGAVGVRGSTSALTTYFFGDIAGTYKIMLISAGAASTLATCSGTPTGSDVMRLSVSGTTLTATIGGAGPGGSPCTVTDATLSSGQPNIVGYGGTGIVTLDNWSADNVGGGGGGSTPFRFPCATLGVGC